MAKLIPGKMIKRRPGAPTKPAGFPGPATERATGRGVDSDGREVFWRERKLIVNFAGIANGAAFGPAQTPGLANDADIMQVQGATSAGTGANNGWSVQWAYQSGEQLVTAVGLAQTVLGRDGLGGHLATPTRIPRGVLITVNGVNNTGGVANFTVCFVVREYYAASSPVGG